MSSLLINFYRWTDGRSWGPSRISGSFLIYRETREKTRKESADSTVSASDYLSDGLVKKTFRIDGTGGKKRHMVSYFNQADVDNCKLHSPLDFSNLAGIRLSSEIYPDFVTEEKSVASLGEPTLERISSHSEYRHHPQHEERAAANYYHQQAQQSSQADNSLKVSRHSPVNHSISPYERFRPGTNNSPLSGKRKAEEDPFGEARRTSQYFVLQNPVSGSTTRAASSNGSSRESSPQPFSSGWRNKLHEQLARTPTHRSTLLSPHSLNSNDSPQISGGPTSASFDRLNPYYTTTPTSLTDANSPGKQASPNKHISNSPLSANSALRQEVPASSLKHEVIPQQGRKGLSEDDWKRDSYPSHQAIIVNPNIRRMSDLTKLKASLLSPLVVPGRHNTNRLNTANSRRNTANSSVAPSPAILSSLSPSQNYTADKKMLDVTLPSISDGGKPVFLAHQTWTFVPQERVYLSEEKL